MSRRQFICPICKGEGDSSHCPCNGIGLITEAEAIEWERIGCVVERLPDPPTEMPTMCHDCAFRKESPERERPWDTWPAIEKLVQDGTPFFCHQGMHCKSDGDYVPLERDAKGAPVGHPVCAGWAAARAKEQR